MESVAKVQVRLVAETKDQAEAAIKKLEELGALLSAPKQGRKGGWLSYGLLPLVDNTSADDATE